MSSKSRKLTISLMENGRHSLSNGITSFDKYIQEQEKSKQSSSNRFLLRDSVMLLHHGIELLMKEILVRKSEFLIFEKLDDAAAKQKTANRQGVGIFSINNPPRTVTYEEAINRVEAFVKPEQLTNQLREKLSRLNSVRNQLEHYAIDIHEDDVIQLIGGIREPLFELLQFALGKDFRPETRQVKSAWDRVEKRAYLDGKAEEDVRDVLSKLAGITVPGNLLNTGKDVTLPVLSASENRMQMYSVNDVGYIPDFVGESNGETWAIEVKSLSSRSAISFEINTSEMKERQGFQLWLIVLADVPPAAKEKSRRLGYYLTDRNDWEKLKGYVSGQGSLFDAPAVKK